MELPSVAPLRSEPRSRTSADLPVVPRRLPRVAPPANWVPERILDFDIETVAAGFADPDWVPQKITCVAWSWIGEDGVKSTIATSEGLFSRPERRRKMLEPLLEEIRKADMVTGHNLLRFDLPVLAAECMRLGLPLVGRKLVQDTMRFKRTKGFKKGQDNLITLTKTPIAKIPLSWQEWQEAYEEKGWAGIKERCETDVLGHKILRERLLERKWLRDPVWWRS